MSSSTQRSRSDLSLLSDCATPGSTAPLTREHWVAMAHHLLLSLRPHFSEGHARVTLPGPRVGSGLDSDGMEGYARSLLLAGFYLAGSHGDDPYGYADFYARGLVAGTDPASPERWAPLREVPQGKVEAASICLILDMTRPWIWDRLSSSEQRNVINYLAPVVDDEAYAPNNWLWFRLVVQTFLRSVDGPHSEANMRADLARHDSFYRGHGWYSDGVTRNYDHYIGWAMHLYPTLWGRMSGAADLAAPRAAKDRARLGRYLQDYRHLIGADGAPLMQGRSLIYRFAAAAPLWVGALAEVDTGDYGELRCAAGAMLRYFASHGAPGSDGLLSVGWWDEFLPMAQSYSGYASPYWATKGMLGIALDAPHPVWTAPEVPFPARQDAPGIRLVETPGWCVSHGDGVVRVVNHGTDHGETGRVGGEAPLYGRLAYSTATFPPMDAESLCSPVDNAVTLVDAQGRRSHRQGLVRGCLTQQGKAALASSRWAAVWVTPDAEQFHFGNGLSGSYESAGSIDVVSVVLEDFEVRLIHLDNLNPAVTSLTVGGWPLSGPGTVRSAVAEAGVCVENDTWASWLASPTVFATTPELAPNVDEVRCGVVVRSAASPLGGDTSIPTVTFPAVNGAWYAVGVGLNSSTKKIYPDIAISHTDDEIDVTISTDEGATRVTLPHGDSEPEFSGSTNQGGDECHASKEKQCHTC